MARALGRVVIGALLATAALWWYEVAHEPPGRFAVRLLLVAGLIGLELRLLSGYQRRDGTLDPVFYLVDFLIWMGIVVAATAFQSA